MTQSNYNERLSPLDHVGHSYLDVLVDMPLLQSVPLGVVLTLLKFDVWAFRKVRTLAIRTWRLLTGDTINRRRA